jgi:hypothetical protein
MKTSVRAAVEVMFQRSASVSYSRSTVDISANPLIETFSQVIPDVFASCGRITGHPEVTPKRVNVQVGDQPGTASIQGPAEFQRSGHSFA